MKPCIFSPCQKYRYTLWREWDIDALTGSADDLPNSQKFVQFIGLNPSTADDAKDDPTIRRCIGFAKRWGYGALCMTNLFAYRATLPSAMKQQADPIGADNDFHLVHTASTAGLIIAAWGNHGVHLNRAAAVKKILPNIHALHINADGSPKHPLYIASSVIPKPYP